MNALGAARHLVIPMNPSLYSMQGTNDLLRTVSKVHTNLNPALSLLGVIINAYDSVPPSPARSGRRSRAHSEGKSLPRCFPRASSWKRRSLHAKE